MGGRPAGNHRAVCQPAGPSLAPAGDRQRPADQRPSACVRHWRTRAASPPGLGGALYRVTAKSPLSADQLARLGTALAGRYAVERELGRGGMATVYLADDLKHRRKVAIKVLRPELSAVLGPDR